MIDLKEQFTNWLLKQNLSEKTKVGRKSTVFEYVRRINHLANNLYSLKNTSSNWDLLAKNIASVLASYYESNNKEYYLSRYNCERFIDHINNTANLCNSDAFPEIEIGIIINSEELSITKLKFNEITGYTQQLLSVLTNFADNEFHQIDTFIGCLRLYNLPLNIDIEKTEQIFNKSYNFGNTFIHIKYGQTNQKKDKVALEKFYDFLQNDNEAQVAALRGERDDKKILTCLKKIESAKEVIMKCKTIQPQTGRQALQIKSHFPNGKITILEACSILNIDYKTLKSLQRNNILIPTLPENMYDEQTINDYLKAHFHPALETYPHVDYGLKEQWSNRREAATILNCTERSVYNYTKRGLLTYTDYSPQAPRYYPPELRYLSSI